MAPGERKALPGGTAVQSLAEHPFIQRRLGSNDALNEHIKHTGSAIFAIPPGARPGGYVGESLFATT
jgi:deferrochelatase/peroxidase EfeB